MLNSDLLFGWLAQEGLDPEYMEDDTEIVLCCPTCSDDKPRLYIGADSGAWICFHCGSQGKLVSLLQTLVGGFDEAYELQRRWFTEEVDPFAPTAVPRPKAKPFQAVELPKEYRPITPEAPAHFTRYLERRSISVELAQSRGIGYCLTGFFRYRIIVPVINGSENLDFLSCLNLSLEECSCGNSAPLVATQISHIADEVCAKVVITNKTVKNMGTILGRNKERGTLEPTLIKEPPHNVTLHQHNGEPQYQDGLVTGSMDYKKRIIKTELPSKRAAVLSAIKFPQNLSLWTMPMIQDACGGSSVDPVIVQLACSEILLQVWKLHSPICALQEIRLDQDQGWRGGTLYTFVARTIFIRCPACRGRVASDVRAEQCSCKRPIPRVLSPTGGRPSLALFNLDTVRVSRQPRLIVMEGWGDALRAPNEAVAILGSSPSPTQISLLAGVARGRDVVVCLDGDNAGRAGALKVADGLASAMIPCRVARVPDGYDPGKLLPDKLKEVLDKAKQYVVR